MLSSRAAVRALAIVACVLSLAASFAAADELRGTVRDRNGAPVPDADFDLYDLAGNKLPPTDNTDASGAYRLRADPGTYDVLIQPPAFSGWAPQWQRGVLIEGVVTLDWTLRSSARALGFTHAATGRSIGAVGIDFDRSVDGVRAPALGNLSSPFGTFAAVVEEGVYVITATPPESTGLAPARLFDWALPSADTLHFRFEVAAHLSGVVRDANGAAVGNARWSFTRASDGARVPSAENRSQPDGSYRARVAPGVYRVTVSAPPGEHLAPRRVEGFDLSADATLDPVMQPGWFVTGTVRDSAGAPLAGCSWTATDLGSGLIVPTPDDRSDVAGRYQFTLAPGTYRLVLTPPTTSGLGPRAIESVSVTQDQTLDVAYGSAPPPPPVSRVQFAPLANPTYRTARLRLALPEDADGVVELFDASGRRVRELLRGRILAGTTVVAWDGRNAGGGTCHTGVYFARLQITSQQRVTRFVLLPAPPR